MDKDRMIGVALIFVFAVLIRFLKVPAPFIWVGQDQETGALVWSKDNERQAIETVHPIPYVALGVPIPLNSADSTVLSSISGLGQVKSQAIVRYRGTHGCFQRLDELRHVRGVGPKTVLKVAPYLRIDAFSSGTCESPLPG